MARSREALYIQLLGLFGRRKVHLGNDQEADNQQDVTSRHPQEDAERVVINYRKDSLSFSDHIDVAASPKNRRIETVMGLFLEKFAASTAVSLAKTKDGATERDLMEQMEKIANAYGKSSDTREKSRLANEYSALSMKRNELSQQRSNEKVALLSDLQTVMHTARRQLDLQAADKLMPGEAEARRARRREKARRMTPRSAEDYAMKSSLVRHTNKDTGGKVLFEKSLLPLLKDELFDTAQAATSYADWTDLIAKLVDRHTAQMKGNDPGQEDSEGLTDKEMKNFIKDLLKELAKAVREAEKAEAEAKGEPIPSGLADSDGGGDGESEDADGDTDRRNNIRPRKESLGPKLVRPSGHSGGSIGGKQAPYPDHDYYLLREEEITRPLTVSAKAQIAINNTSQLSIGRLRQSGEVTDKVAEMNFGDLDVFREVEDSDTAIVIGVDCSGSMGCLCGKGLVSSETKGYLAWSVAQAIRSKFKQAYVFGFYSNEATRYGQRFIHVVSDGRRPACHCERKADIGVGDIATIHMDDNGMDDNGIHRWFYKDGTPCPVIFSSGQNPDCTALQHIGEKLTGDMQNAVAVIISDGQPASGQLSYKTGGAHDDDQHTRYLAHRLASQGLSYVSIGINYKSDIYPAKLMVNIDSANDIPAGLGKVFDLLAEKAVS